MLSRVVGLLRHKSLAEDAALLIVPCNSIHTWFMRFDIDAVFLTREMEVVSIFPDLPPWKVAWGGKGAFSVIELPAGRAGRAGLKTGDRLALGPPAHFTPSGAA